MKPLRPLAILGLLLAAGCATAPKPEAPANPAPTVVPAVQSWSGGTGYLPMTKIASYRYVADSACQDLATELQRRDLDLPGSTVVRLRLVDDPALGDEGYRLDIGNTIEISGRTTAGVFYGTRTLLQMRQTGPLPRGTIVDRPKYAGRMLMLDVGRKPYPIPVLKDYIRLMAWYKMNELHLHLSDASRGTRYAAYRIESRKFPGLHAKDLFYTWEELRDLQDFAKANHVTITPEIDMPGHANCFTNAWPDLKNPKLEDANMDLFNPKTAERMKEVLAEAIPLFDAPDFHIGTDEFRMGRLSKEEQKEMGETFRKFINEMNAFVRSQGKTTRIWSGFEHMPGTTLPDPDITIDMWVTNDATAMTTRGNRVINSNHGRTYIVPGAHYYGVDNKGIYNGWEPWMFSGDAKKNPAPDDPKLLGGKLHVWNDQGPAGYDHYEIADLTLPSLQAFAEKLWGTKGSPDYAAFQARAALTVPKLPLLKRGFADIPPDGVVYELPEPKELKSTDEVVYLPWSIAATADLEFPWTLEMEVMKTAESGKRGVILSSDLVEICADFALDEEKKVKGADGKEIKTKVKRQGLGLVRAAGAFGKDPLDSVKSDQTSRIYSDPLPLNQWVNITIVGERGRTSVYVDGKKTGESNNQMVCPLRQLGSKTGNSFVGSIRALKVTAKATPPEAPQSTPSQMGSP